MKKKIYYVNNDAETTVEPPNTSNQQTHLRGDTPSLTNTFRWCITPQTDTS